jgi:small-conductance mechanosensitive channel
MMRLPRLSSLRRLGVPGTLLLLLLVLLLGQHLISGGDPSLEFNAPPALPSSSGLVDQSRLRTARELASQAAVPQEAQYAQEALRLADSELDHAFATALRTATEQAPPLTGEALRVSQRLNALNDHIRAEQAGIAARQRDQAAKAAPQDDAQLELAEAQLALDTDEADELHQTLIRLGGDRRAILQQALDEHEAVHKSDTGPAISQTAPLEAPQALTSLVGKLRAASSLRQRHRLLRAAQDAAVRRGRQLLAERGALSRETENASQSGGDGTTVARLRTLASRRQTLTQYERRIHDLESLAAVYDKWDTLVLAQQRTILRRILRVFVAIVAILALTLLASRLLHRLLTSRTLLDRRRQQTLQFVLSFAVQLVGALLILIVIFGTPQQTPTVIGLATAGLTVVLKDFIVAFFGWFILMGKSGVRVGDWVEINGVDGEVTEVGLLRTTLLETGNWAESGRPTGRRVAFMNSYAIEGHYFNFSTAGQWLWEEMRVAIPAGADAYAVKEAIRVAIEEITQESNELAAREWRRLTPRNGSARTPAMAPVVELRPGGTLEVVIRYITRAQDRFDARSRLYQRLLSILHGPPQFASREMPVQERAVDESAGIEEPVAAFQR